MEPKRHRNFCIAQLCLFGLALGPSGMAALTSPMIFDAPGSDHKIVFLMIFAGLLTLPISFLVAAVMAAAGLRGHLWAGSRAWILPTVHVVILLLVFSLPK